jgi:3-oxoacyl-(acyl-carrier-protein) synthase/thioesterase domain-containing protein/acyl carrier protein
VTDTTSTAVAIVGMAGRFPGADSVPELWRNLVAGAESPRTLSRQELLDAGVAESTASHRDYVPVASELADADAFDAQFFDVSAHEARLMDPQQRVFLECAWWALEDAGHDPGRSDQRIGVFASGSMSSYLVNVLAASEEVTPGEVSYPLLLGNDKDFLATRVSYKLGLTGPSVTVQSACSGSLVAVHLACQALLDGDCSVALAGGVSISVPQGRGYLYREGGIMSPDGRCRVFDADAAGTVKGSGCAVVVLRPLADALAAGDHVYAVLRGTATNNDGAQKVGFTAPSPAGQAEVIREAVQVSGVPVQDIGFVEAHGTGTPLGDPIELRGLRTGHASLGPLPRRCVLGSIKANIGHLDAAAGVTGLVKTALVLQEQVIPGQPTFRAPHPGLELAGTPYVVLRETESPAEPLQAAAVSSFGLGGTNAHAVLSRWEEPSRPPVPDGPYVVLLSAADDEALAATAQRLRDRLAESSRLRLDDVAHTLATGRAALPARAALQVGSLAELQDRLADVAAGRGPGTAAGGTEASWQAGADPGGLDVGDTRHARRVPLPGQPFRRTRHWATARPAAAPAPVVAAAPDAETRAGRDLLEEVRAVLVRHLAVDVDPDADVFELGLDSMTLVEVVTDLRDTVGVPFGFDEAESARTVRQLAGLLAPRLRAGDAGPGAPGPDAVPDAGPAPAPRRAPHAATTIRAGTGGRRLFLVHPAGGTTVCYGDLARHLSTRDAVHGIGFPAGLAGDVTSIRDLAELYLSAVREVQPQGPYLLGGYSFGGNVAFEMALRLEAAGERVERVLMFDSHPPEAYVGGRAAAQTYVEAFPALLGRVFPDLAVPEGLRPGSVADVLRAVRRPTWTAATERELEGFFRVWQHNHAALKRYYPDAVLEADVLMFAAEEPEHGPDLDRLGIREVPKGAWRTHLRGELRRVAVPGDHYSMFRDPGHLAVLAQRLDEALAAA